MIINLIYIPSSVDCSLKVIPSDIDQFFNVNCVSINYSSISHLPKELFNLDLISLEISFSYVTIIPREIENLVNLEEINIGGNMLQKLPKEIFNLKKVYYSYFNQNKFIDTYGNHKRRLKTLNDNNYIN